MQGNFSSKTGQKVFRSNLRCCFSGCWSCWTTQDDFTQSSDLELSTTFWWVRSLSQSVKHRWQLLRTHWNVSRKKGLSGVVITSCKIYISSFPSETFGSNYSSIISLWCKCCVWCSVVTNLLQKLNIHHIIMSRI